MLSEKLLTALNDQIQYEFHSANLYLAMAAYCADQDLEGFSHWFLIQAEEERFHAMKFFHYVNDMEGRVQIKGMEDPTNEYESVLDAFKKALAHEKSVTKRIYALMDLAVEEKEHATISFLKWFIDEQVEEEASVSAIIKQLERIDSSSLFLLDKELGQRTFTPPTQQ